MILKLIIKNNKKGNRITAWVQKHKDIVDDLFPKKLMNRLDDAIYQEKYRLLITPHFREEIDYVVKRLGRVREQVRFNTFKHMVACKILQEGTFLYGSEKIFYAVNKIDSEKQEDNVADFYSLGVDHLFPVSAMTGYGMGELFDAQSLNSLIM